MSLVILRGLSRQCHSLEQSFALSKLYSTRWSDDKKPPVKTINESSNTALEPTSDVKKSVRTPEKVGEDIRGYVFTRYINYVKNYEAALEKRYPAAMKVYRLFMDGMKDFFKDMMSLLKIKANIASEGGMETLTRKEMELNYQMPRDMFKIAPVLILSVIPFGHYVVFPIAYMYPRHLLTSHFWTIQQRNEFAVRNLQNRLEYNRSVFRILQSKLDKMEKNELYEKWNHILVQMGSGLHPTTNEIIETKDVWIQPPYNPKSCSSKHVKYLCGLHGIHRGPFKRSRLTYRVNCIHLMDRAIVREGGVQNMSIDALRNSCFIRGLNAANMSNEDLTQWLQSWVDVSITAVDRTNFLLLLHLPILLGYNHPNNWHLIYKERPVTSS